MNRPSILLAICLVVSTAVAVQPAFSAESPFEPGLMRLAEVLGSLHFLRNLCGEKGDQLGLKHPCSHYAAAILRIKSSCSALLSAPIVNASSTPELSANLIPSS